MSHNIIVIIMSTVPESVKDLTVNPAFNSGTFNTGKTKRLIDGYVVDENENIIPPKTLCQDEHYLLYLCRMEPDPAECVQYIITNSYELKTSDYLVMKSDVNSEWYKPEGEI